MLHAAEVVEAQHFLLCCELRALLQILQGACRGCENGQPRSTRINNTCVPVVVRMLCTCAHQSVTCSILAQIVTRDCASWHAMSTRTNDSCVSVFSSCVHMLAHRDTLGPCLEPYTGCQMHQLCHASRFIESHRASAGGLALELWPSSHAAHFCEGCMHMVFGGCQSSALHRPCACVPHRNENIPRASRRIESCLS